MSKFALDVAAGAPLERCVFRFAAPTADPDVLVAQGVPGARPSARTRR